MSQKKLKEQSETAGCQYVHISIDPGSVSTGIAVFSVDGKYLDGFEVKVPEGMVATMRLYHIRRKFIEEWEKRFGENTKANYCVLERLPPGNALILSNAAGAILSSGKIEAKLDNKSCISPSSWKYLLRALGCKMEKPKGVQALKDIGWKYPMPDGDDQADAIHLYLTSAYLRQTIIWLGDLFWQKSWYTPKTKKKPS